MSDINCSVVKDLLPLYIEELTSKDTNKYIHNHLKVCDECRTYLKEIKEDTNMNLDISREVILDKGEVILNNIKKNQDGIKYTFIIFSMFVSVSSSILAKGFVATIPLIIIVPFILKIFYDEDRVIFITAILAQLVISIASDNLVYGMFTLPVNIICISSGLVAGKHFRNII